MHEMHRNDTAQSQQDIEILMPTTWTPEIASGIFSILKIIVLEWLPSVHFPYKRDILTGCAALHKTAIEALAVQSGIRLKLGDTLKDVPDRE